MFRGIREVPAWPTAAIAAVLVVALGVGILAYSGIGRGGSSATKLLARQPVPSG